MKFSCRFQGGLSPFAAKMQGLQQALTLNNEAGIILSYLFLYLKNIFLKMCTNFGKNTFVILIFLQMLEKAKRDIYSLLQRRSFDLE